MAWEALGSIVAIILIVVTAGGLIALIARVVLNLGENKTSTRTSRNNYEVMDYEQYKKQEMGYTNGTEEDLPFTKEYDFEAINKAKAKEEERLVKKASKDADENEIYKLLESEDDEDLEAIESRLKLKNEKEEAERVDVADLAKEEFVDVDSIVSEISDEVVNEEMDREHEEATTPDPTLEKYNIDEILKSLEEKEETKEEVVEEAKEEPAVEPVEETKEEPKDDASQQIIEDLKAQLAELNKQLEEAKAQPVTTSTVVTTVDMTEEECVARLNTLEERLKNVKKDYKINLKEYKPLKKVMNDLDKYQTKLRRKETIVAKKKVALYGVNNYVDIDKEKAEKLANEIELLDGLRLSVNHCEEVIEANKDRYPILEHTNAILEEQIANIEADIASTQATLDKIRANNGTGESENNGEGTNEE